MDSTLLLILLISSGVIAVVLISLFKKKPVSNEEEAASDYAEGLNLLLLGNPESALKKFREAVTKDSQNIDAYLKIGDILRESNQIDRAINVHKYLTVRRGLTAKQHLEILQSLALDYCEAKEYDKALAVVDKILEENKGLAWAYELEVKLFERKEEWDKAFQAGKELGKINSKFKNGRLALYKVEEGLRLMENGQSKEAQNHFKDAIKIGPESPPAYIYLADFYMKEERKSDALSVLKEFVEKVPSQSFLAFERIKELLYEGGVYGEIENVYLDIIKSQPDNLIARLALAENYEKKGEVDKAIEACQEVLERESGNKSAKKLLVQFYHKTGESDQALNLALELIDESLQQRENFICKNCNYESDQPFWKCPNCHEWETAVKN